MGITPVKSADRTLDIFELFAAEPRGLTISEISDRLGLARSSTHGLVHTLAARGYLVQDGGGRFQLGARLIQLGLNVVDRLELRSAARGTLERLVAVTHDTALQDPERRTRRAHGSARELTKADALLEPRKGATRGA